MLAVAELEDALLGDDALEAERPEVTQVAPVEQCRRHAGHQRLAAMTGGGKPGRDDQGRTEVALPPLLGLTGVQADPNPDVDLRGPPFAAHRGLQLGGPCGRVAGAMEGDAERVTTGGEDVAAVTIDCGRDEIVMASHRLGHLATVRRPQPGRVLDVGEPERHRPGRNAQRRTHRRPIDAQLLVLAEDQRLQLAEPRARLDPEPLDEVLAGPAIRGERIGLAAHPVQRRHQQRPQSLAERVGRRQLGQRADHRMRVGLDAPPQVGLHRPEVLLDQPVDRRRQTLGVEPGEGSARPLGERGLGVVEAEQPLEANDVDRSGRHVQTVGDTGPDDRVGAEALAQSRHVRLERLVGRPRRLLAPHQPDDARDRYRRTGRQGEHGEHGLALRRADVDRFTVVGRGGDATEQTNLHLDRAPFRFDRRRFHDPSVRPGGCATSDTRLCPG